MAGLIAWGARRIGERDTTESFRAIELRDGRAEAPAVRLTTDEDTWAGIASGKISTSSATARGALSVAGEAQAVERLRKILSRNHMLAGSDPASGPRGEEP
jgi:hypothetical protein